MHASFRVTGLLPDLVLSVVRDGNAQDSVHLDMSGRSARSADCGSNADAMPPKGIPLRAYENNQFRSVARRPRIGAGSHDLRNGVTF